LGIPCKIFTPPFRGDPEKFPFHDRICFFNRNGLEGPRVSFRRGRNYKEVQQSKASYNKTSPDSYRAHPNKDCGDAIEPLLAVSDGHLQSSDTSEPSGDETTCLDEILQSCFVDAVDPPEKKEEARAIAFVVEHSAATQMALDSDGDNM
jgi:hypothetical protein